MPSPRVVPKRRRERTDDEPELVKKRPKKESELTMSDRKNAAAKLNASARVRYTLGKMDEAVIRLKASLKVWPHNSDAYQMMGLIMQDRGDERTALELWLLQAHFDKKNTVLWQDLFHLARKLGCKREEVFCITQLHSLLLQKVRDLRKSGKEAEAKAAENRSLEVMKHRLDLLEDISEWNLAIDGYRKLISQNPLDAESVHRLVRLYVKVMLREKAAAVCEQFFANAYANQEKIKVDSDMFLRVANLALELQLEMGHFTAAIEFVDRLVDLQKKNTLKDLHPELSVKACIALAYKGDVSDSLDKFREIRQNLPTQKFGDLFFDYAMTLMKCGHSRDALAMLEGIVAVDDKFACPVVVLAIAKCNAQIADELDGEGACEQARERRVRAEKLFRAIYNKDKASTETRLALAMLLVKLYGSEAHADIAELLDYRQQVEMGWSPTHSMAFAVEAAEVFKHLKQDEVLERIVEDIFAGLTAPPDDGAISHAFGKDTQKAAGNSRLLRLGKTHASSVLFATSVIHSETYGQSGSAQPTAVEAVAALPLHPEKTNVARAAANKAIADLSREHNVHRRGKADMEGSVFQLNKLGAKHLDAGKQHVNSFPSATPDADLDLGVLEDLRDDLIVARFLATSEVLREAYELARSESNACSEDRSDIMNPSELSHGDADNESLGQRSDATPQDQDCDDDGAEEVLRESLAVPVARRAAKQPSLSLAVLERNERLLVGKQAVPKSVLLQNLLSRHGRDTTPEEALARLKTGMPGMRDTDHPEMMVAHPLGWSCATFHEVVVRSQFGVRGAWRLLRWYVERAIDLFEEGTRRLLDKAIHFMTRFMEAGPIEHAFSLLRYRPLMKKQVYRLRMLCTLIAGDLSVAFQLLRRQIQTDGISSNHAWNTLSSLLLLRARHTDLRPTLRHLVGSNMNQSLAFPLYMVMGNCLAHRHASGRLALGPYLSAHKIRPREPLVPLVIAATYAIQVSTRFNPNRHYTILHAMGFFDTYKRLRELDPVCLSEIEYNTGRLFHQWGLTSTAAEHYQKVLDMSTESIRFSGDDSILSMHREAAFNLHLILRQSGNDRAAADVLRKYIVA